MRDMSGSRGVERDRQLELHGLGGGGHLAQMHGIARAEGVDYFLDEDFRGAGAGGGADRGNAVELAPVDIGGALYQQGARESVGEGKRVSVRVEFGGRVLLKKQTVNKKERLRSK